MNLPASKEPPIVSTVMHWYLVFPIGSARKPAHIWPRLIIALGAQLSQPAYIEAPPSSVKRTATMDGQMTAMA